MVLEGAGRVAIVMSLSRREGQDLMQGTQNFFPGRFNSKQSKQRLAPTPENTSGLKYLKTETKKSTIIGLLLWVKKCKLNLRL